MWHIKSVRVAPNLYNFKSDFSDNFSRKVVYDMFPVWWIICLHVRSSKAVFYLFVGWNVYMLKLWFICIGIVARTANRFICFDCCCFTTIQNCVAFLTPNVSFQTPMHTVGCVFPFTVYLLFVNIMLSVLWCCWLCGRKGIQPVKS